MVSMKLKPKSTEALKAEMPEYQPPAYPYGLCLSLNEESISKLGLDKLPSVGSTVTVMAKATVVRAAINESLLTGQTSTPERNLELQITDLEVEPEKKKAPIEETLYGKA